MNDEKDDSNYLSKEKFDELTAELEHLKPAPIAQLTVPEIVFWTKERKLQVGAALAVMILGILYLFYATGIKNAPERAEGEL